MSNREPKLLILVGLPLSFALALGSFSLLAVGIADNIGYGLPRGSALTAETITFLVLACLAAIGVLGVHRFAILRRYHQVLRLGAEMLAQDPPESMPELRQFGTLTKLDFERHPIWMSVHVVDYDAPWHEETDEETFRPWPYQIPAHPALATFLVRAQFRLRNGTKLSGFLTPAQGIGRAFDIELSKIDPSIFTQDGRIITFYGGLFGFSEESKRAVYAQLAKGPEQLFPVRFRADSGLCVGKQSGSIPGFIKLIDMGNRKLEISW